VHEAQGGTGALDSAIKHSRSKTVISDGAGEVAIDVPRDREGTFEPQIVKKRQRRLTDVDESRRSGVGSSRPAR
jgi:transposase-like protein